MSQSVNGSGGTVKLNDNVTLANGKSISGNTLNLGTSTLTVNNTASGAINVASLTSTGASGLNLANGTIQSSTFGNVKLGGDVTTAIDINLDTKTADTFTVSGVDTGSIGKIMINNFNVIGSTSFADIKDANYKLKILNTSNNNIQLGLTGNAVAQLGGERVLSSNESSSSDAIRADTLWSDTYWHHHTTTTNYGTLGLTKTTTDNDSIGMINMRTEVNTVDTLLGDTLVLVNAATNVSNKTFNATQSNPNYTLSANLTDTKGNLTITGLGSGSSTLDLNGKTGFNVGSGATLNLQKLTLTSSNGNSTLTNGSNLSLSDTIINNSIVFTNNSNLNLSGSNTINTAINGANGAIIVNSGNTLFNKTVTQKNLTVNADATLKTNADNLAIANAITNNGALQLTGGTLTKAVNGNGTTIALEGSTILGAKLTQKDLSINSGATLTANADNLAISNAISNSGALHLTGGTLSKAVNGSGSVTAKSGTTTVNTVLTQQKLTIDSGATLKSNVDNLITTEAISNNGALQIYSAAVNNPKYLHNSINGNGGTVVTGGAIYTGDYVINQKDFTIDEGAVLTSNADNLIINNAITNNGIANLQGGTLATAVNGSGKINIGGTNATSLNGRITQKDLYVDTYATLNIRADDLVITNVVDNDGTIVLKGGELGQSVNKTTNKKGSVVINGADEVSLSADKTITADDLYIYSKLKIASENVDAVKFNTLHTGNIETPELDIANGHISEFNAPKIQLNKDILLDVDVDIKTDEQGSTTDSAIDTIKIDEIAEDSVGKFIINKFNVISEKQFADIKDTNFKVQILKSPSNGTQLQLGDQAQAQLGGEHELYRNPNSEDEPIKEDTAWNHEYLRHNYENITYGTLVLATTDTENDSIGMISRLDPVHTTQSMGDTLWLVNKDTENTVKSFTATEEAADYTLKQDLAEETVGNLTVKGLGAETSTLDMNSKKGFTLANSAELNLTDLTIENAADNNLVTITDESGKLSLNNVNLNGDINSLKNTAIKVSGKSNLNGEFKNAKVYVDNADITINENTFADADVRTTLSEFRFDNGELENYTFNKLDSGSVSEQNSKYYIDVDITNQQADMITTAQNSTAQVTIDGLNIINGSFDDLPADMTDQPFMIKILNTPNNNTQLVLGPNAKRQLPLTDYEVGRRTVDCDDVVPANVKWSDVYYHKTQDEIYYGNIGLATSVTTNDSIGLTLTGSRMGPKIVHDSLGDTLKLLNTSSDYSEKFFTAHDASDTYVATDNLGSTYGTLLITGYADENGVSTIDLNGYDGFNIDENSAVTIRDAAVINSGDTSDIVVQKGGSLTLDNTPAENINLTIDGNLDITNSILKAENAVFGSDAQLSLRVDTLDKHGLFAAKHVEFADKAKLNVTLANNLVKVGQVEDIQLLKADDGDYAAMAETFDNNMYRFEKKNDNGWYTIRLLKTAEEIVTENNGSETAKEAAKAWVDGEHTTKNKLAEELNDLAQNDAVAFTETITALAPVDAPMVQAVEADNSGLFGMLTTHLRDAQEVSAGSSAPRQEYYQQPYRSQYNRSQYNNNSYYRPQYNGSRYSRPQQKQNNNYRPSYSGQGYTYGLSSGDMINPAAIWLNAYKGKSELEKHENIQGFKTDRNGMLAAVEKRFNSAFKAGLGYQFERNEIEALKRKTDVDTNRGFVYAEYQPSNFFINGALSYSVSKYKEKKKIIDQQLAASYNASTFAVQTTVGYEGRYFTPETGIRYYSIKRDEYTDDAKQKVEAGSMNVLRGVAGVRAGFDVNSGYRRILRPEIYAGVSYDIVSDSDEATVTLPTGETYKVHGESLDKFGVEAGAGITADITSRFSLKAQYLGTFRKNYSSHTGMFGLKYQF